MLSFIPCASFPLFSAVFSAPNLLPTHYPSTPVSPFLSYFLTSSLIPSRATRSSRSPPLPFPSLPLPPLPSLPIPDYLPTFYLPTYLPTYSYIQPICLPLLCISVMPFYGKWEEPKEDRTRGILPDSTRAAEMGEPKWE